MARRQAKPKGAFVILAADRLELSDDALARVLRCSAETVGRYRAGEELVATETHLQNAASLLEVERLVRSQRERGQTSAQWLRAFNHNLDAHPIDLLVSEWGIDGLISWLRARQPPKSPSASRTEIAEPARVRRTPRKVAKPEPRAATSPPEPQPASAAEGAGWWVWVAGGAAAAAGAAVAAVLWVGGKRR